MSSPVYNGSANLLCDGKVVLTVQCSLELDQTAGKKELTGIITASSPRDLFPYISTNDKPDNLDLTLPDGSEFHITWLEGDGTISCYPLR